MIDKLHLKICEKVALFIKKYPFPYNLVWEWEIAAFHLWHFSDHTVFPRLHWTQCFSTLAIFRGLHFNSCHLVHVTIPSPSPSSGSQNGIYQPINQPAIFLMSCFPAHFSYHPCPTRPPALKISSFLPSPTVATISQFSIFHWLTSLPFFPNPSSLLLQMSQFSLSYWMAK